MFFLNPKDADGLLEDVAMLQSLQRQRNRYYGPTAEELRKDQELRDERSLNIRLAAGNVQLSNALNAARKKFSNQSSEQTELKAFIFAAMFTLDAILKELAALINVPLAQAREHAYAVMREAYDIEISQRLVSGRLAVDPRKDADIWNSVPRSWYGAGVANSDPARLPKFSNDENAPVEFLAQARLREMEAQQFGTSPDQQRAKYLHEARAESIRLGLEKLKFEASLKGIREKLADGDCRHHDLGAYVLAAMAALDPALVDLASASRRTLDSVRDTAYAGMSSAYDKAIEMAIAAGTVAQDPRKNASIWQRPTRRWYRSAADSARRP
jgi:hypothetical protein